MLKFLNTLILTIVAASPVVAGETVGETIQEQTVHILTEKECGSGVIFHKFKKAYVLTCAHVLSESYVKDAYNVRVYHDLYQDGDTYKREQSVAKVLSISTQEDLAVLELQDYIGVSGKLYDGRVPRAGTPVYLCGAPENLEGTLSKGIISRLHRKLDNVGYFDQVDCRNWGGNSGGGIFNEKGEVLGIWTRYQVNSHFSFMVPARRVRKWLKSEKLDWVID